MELPRLEERPAVYAWKGIKVFYRKRMTVGDKYDVEMSGTVVGKEKISFNASDFYRNLVRVFVTGWEGVTREGKDVPYSFESLLSLPCESGDSLIMNLGYRIAVDTGLIQEKTDDAKNV